MNPDGDERRRSTGRRSDDDLIVRMAGVEDALGRVVLDVRDAKAAAIDGLAALEKRVVFLEDVRVRSLEDWRLSQSVLDRERAKRAAAAERLGLSHRERIVVVSLGLLTLISSWLLALLNGHVI